MVNFSHPNFCLGSYEQKKLLEKISDIFLFLRFYSHFFHLFLQWSNTSQNIVLCFVPFKENLKFVKQVMALKFLYALFFKAMSRRKWVKKIEDAEKTVHLGIEKCTLERFYMT